MSTSPRMSKVKWSSGTDSGPCWTVRTTQTGNCAPTVLKRSTLPVAQPLPQPSAGSRKYGTPVAGLLLDRHGLAVACNVREGDRARLQIGGVAGVDVHAVLANHANAGQSHPGAVDGLAVGNRRRDLAGVPHDGKAPRTKDGDPPITGQAHRIDAQQIGVQWQVAVGHRAVAHAGSRDRLGAEDLAITAHPIRRKPRLALVAGGRDLGAKPHPHQSGFVVHAAMDTGRLDLAVDASGDTLRPTDGAGVLEGERPWS